MAGQVPDDAEFPDYTTDCDFTKLLWSYCLVKSGVWYTQGKEKTKRQGHRYFKIFGEKKKVVILWFCDIINP